MALLEQCSESLGFLQESPSIAWPWVAEQFRRDAIGSWLAVGANRAEGFGSCHNGCTNAFASERAVHIVEKSIDKPAAIHRETTRKVDVLWIGGWNVEFVRLCDINPFDPTEERGIIMVQ